MSLGVWTCRSALAAAESRRDRPELVVVPEDRPWLLALAAPTVGSADGNEEHPLLLASSASASAEGRALVARLAPHRALVLSRSGEIFQDGIGKLAPEYFEPSRSSLATSIAWAKRFWDHPEEIVVARRDDAEAVILGSVLAAHRSEPLVVYDATETDAEVTRRLNELLPQRIVVAACRDGANPSWTSASASRCELAGRQSLQAKTVAAIGVKNIRTIVLARVPESNDKTARTAWLAPGLSAVRRAPVVLCDNASAEEAESQVMNFVKAHGLHPRTVTILADYQAIKTRRIKIPSTDSPRESAVEIATEPCLPVEFGETAMVGVGRIPFSLAGRRLGALGVGIRPSSVVGPTEAADGHGGQSDARRRAAGTVRNRQPAHRGRVHELRRGRSRILSTAGQ